jgi:nucleoside-triphosphatase
MKHLLILGRPGVGKTTLMKRLSQSVRHRSIDGFLTEELCEGLQRMGFWLSPLDGRQILLAHRRMQAGIRVGPYRVNVSVLDQIAVSVIRRGLQTASVLFLDELGKMELASPLFTRTVQEAFDKSPVVIATASVSSVPFLNALKRRKDVELIPLSAVNRTMVEEELTARLEALCAEDNAIRALETQANRICELITSGDSSAIDIEIKQQALQESVKRAFPHNQMFYELVYENRFRRLWQQFRHE